MYVCTLGWKNWKFYAFLRYTDDDKAKEKDLAKASSRAALDRYLFHFHRFANHENSGKLQVQVRERSEATVVALSANGGSFSDVAFVSLATEEAILCRQVLKWTYVLAFSMEEQTSSKELFTNLQQDLETRVEQLSGLLESDPATLALPDTRQKVLALTTVVARSRKALLKGAPETAGDAGKEGGASGAP